MKDRRLGLFILMFLMFVLHSGSCDIWNHAFQRNPNLELILKSDWDSFFNPVWSPGGRYIYYLRAHRNNLPTYATALGIGGDLWRIDLETRKTEFLLSGPFCSLAISHDGSLLALSYETGNNELEWNGGSLILVDTSGNILDTLPTSLPLILDVEFSSNDSMLYYYAYDTVHTVSSFGFYRIHLDGSGEELVRENYDYWNMKFSLDHRDSIFIGNWNFNHVKRDYAVLVVGNILITPPSEIYIVEVTNNDTRIPDADPYGPPEELSGFESAYWSPDGNELVISVGKVQGKDVISVLNLELWILHKVW